MYRRNLISSFNDLNPFKLTLLTVFCGKLKVTLSLKGACIGVWDTLTRRDETITLSPAPDLEVRLHAAILPASQSPLADSMEAMILSGRPRCSV